jgi:hypothetical protein
MPILKHVLTASTCVLVVLTGLMLWSHLDYATERFPDFQQFRIYSASAFAALIILISVLLKRGAGYVSALSILLLSGFAIFLAVGTCRFLLGGGVDTWHQAVSGPSRLSTSLVLNGGFLSIVAVLSYALARAAIFLLSARRNRS